MGMGGLGTAGVDPDRLGFATLARAYEAMRAMPDSEYRRAVERAMVRAVLRAGGAACHGGRQYAWSRVEGSLLRQPAPWSLRERPKSLAGQASPHRRKPGPKRKGYRDRRRGKGGVG